MDTRDAIKAWVTGRVLRHMLRADDAQRRLHHTQLCQGIGLLTGEELQRRLAYWIYRSDYANDAYRDWLLAELLLRNEHALSVTLIYVGRGCPDNVRCTSLLAKAIESTLSDRRLVARMPSFAYRCAKEILADTDLMYAMTLRLDQVVFDYCSNCSRAASIIMHEHLSRGAKEDWLLCETCANMLRGLKGLQGKGTPASAETVREALYCALNAMDVPGRDQDSYGRLVETKDSPFVHAINAMADV
jgi:hypothetical protein